MSNVKVEIEGLKELEIKLTDPQLVGKPMRRLVRDAAKIGKNAAIEGIDGGLGLAQRSIVTNVRPTTATVYSMIADDKVQSIEEGRPAGTDPKRILPQIIRWKDAVGHSESGREIALEIERKGTKGKRFLAHTREVVQDELPRLLSAMGRKIKEAFHR